MRIKVRCICNEGYKDFLEIGNIYNAIEKDDNCYIIGMCRFYKNRFEIVDDNIKTYLRGQMIDMLMNNPNLIAKCKTHSTPHIIEYQERNKCFNSLNGHFDWRLVGKDEKWEVFSKLNKGDNIKVISGRFEGCEGIITDINVVDNKKPIIVTLNNTKEFNNCVCFVGYEDIKLLK